MDSGFLYSDELYENFYKKMDDVTTCVANKNKSRVKKLKTKTN